MGALAQDGSWIPQDDFLLKNAVEAGASLESLAKGAVLFSRRFTVQELQDRWNCLLYDPLVSAEASAWMTEIERSKENKCFSEKRKFDSVRQQYYAMRKRIHNEPLDSMDIGCIAGPGSANGVVTREHPLSPGCILTNPLQNHVGLQDSNFNIMNPALTKTGSGTVTGLDATDLAYCTGEDISIDQNNIDNITLNFEENISLLRHCSVVEELGQFEEVCNNLFVEADGGIKLPAIADQAQTGEVSGYSGFRGCQDFNSTVPDCGASFHALGYSSPLPDLPVWSAIESLSCPTLPGIQVGIGDGNAHATSELGYDVGQSGSDAMLENQMSCDDMRNSGSSTDDYLAELSNSLFDFTNEEELLLMHSDENTIDKFYMDGLSSLLLDSPSPDGLLDIAATEASVPSDDCTNISDSTCHGEFVAGHSDSQQRPSSLYPEYRNGVICCVLNTEDPDIPCNDDVFLLTRPSLSEFALPFEMQWKIYEPPPLPTSSFSRDSALGQEVIAGGPNQIMRERNSFEQSFITSPMMGSHLRTEIGVSLPLCDNGFNLESPKTDGQSVAWKASSPCHGPSQPIPVSLGGCSFLPEPLNEMVVKTEQTNCPGYNSEDFCLDKQAGSSDRLISFPQNNDIGSNQHAQTPATFINKERLHAEVGPTELTIPDLEVRHSPTDQDEFPTWSDDDVPCYSDIEGMILEMDLSPDDQDIYPRRTVSKYEREDAKRVIIRLEQTADACMRRSMSSQGAFAVLYGRDSKYYIKKPEVLLGRSTEGIIVDIDLGREGQNSKVSRRQAVIVMEKDGSFVLRNLGRYSIFVNCTEVAPKQSLCLSPSCLIEVRGIPFVFETNETCIKQYLDDVNNES